MDPINDTRTDNELAAASIGDGGAFATLVRRYEARLDRYLRRIGVHVAEDRQDVLQTAFMNAYRNLNGFDPGQTFSSWVYRIARNAAIDAFRARKARPATVSGEEAELALAVLKDDGATPEVSAAISADSARVVRALASLPERDREVLELRFFEELGYDEIADVLKVPPGTVATWISRAKAKLGTLLHADSALNHGRAN